MTSSCLRRPIAAPTSLSSVAVLLLVCACLAGGARQALADTYQVRVGGSRVSGASTPGDWSAANCYGTIKQAAAAALPADEVVLYEETHTVQSAIVLKSLLAAQTDGVGNPCVVQMQDSGHLLGDPTLASTTIRGVEISGGSTVPAVQFLDWSANPRMVFIEDCDFERNDGTYSTHAGGSALVVFPSPSGGLIDLTVEDTDFTMNTSQGRGGAVYLASNVLATFRNCMIQDNQSTPPSVLGGGGLALVAGNAPSSLTMENCQILGNRSRGPGGGLFVWDADVTMDDCQVRDNLGAFDGMALWTAGAGIEVGRSKNIGGDTNLILRNCEFTGNIGNLALGTTAGDGGGAHAYGVGPGEGMVVEVSDTHFANNFNAQGAGLYLSRYAVGTVDRCTFVDNSARYGGAAFKGGPWAANLGETLTFRYCTFVRNFASILGGAFMARLNPRGEFINCSFADNRADDGGDSIFSGAFQDLGQPYTDDGQRCSVINSVFYGTVGTNAQIEGDDLAYDQIDHCAYESGQFVSTGVTPTSTVGLTASPYVDLLTDLHLAAGSPCIDAGVDLGVTVDLEGLAVPQGVTRDIGAHESMAATATPPADFSLWTQAFPNPTAGPTVLSWRLPVPEALAVSIYDARGRLVWTREVPRADVQGSVVWRGRDARGRSVAAGTYVWVVRTAGSEQGGKIQLLR